MSNGMPYVKWHGRDWLGDPLLRMVGPEARGVWMDLLCAMMQADPYGYLAVNGRAMTDDEASRLVGMPADEYRAVLGALEEAGVSSRAKNGMLFSRRLVRDHQAFENGRKYGKKGGGNPRLKAPLQPKPSEKARSQKPEAKERIKHPFIGTEIPATLTAAIGFTEMWTAFLENRAAKKAKATPQAQKLILATLSQRPGQAVEALKIAITRNWTGFQWEWIINSGSKLGSTYTPARPVSATPITDKNSGGRARISDFDAPPKQKDAK